MFDDHLWFSVSHRPNKSNFTRVQRLSMCLSTLFLAMVVNAMFYDMTGTQVDTTPVLLIGTVAITYRTVFVGTIGALIAVFPNIVVQFLFRKSKPRPLRNPRRVEQVRLGQVWTVPRLAVKTVYATDSQSTKDSGREDFQRTAQPFQGKLLVWAISNIGAPGAVLNSRFSSSHRLSVVGLRPSSWLSTGCVVSLRGY